MVATELGGKVRHLLTKVRPNNLFKARASPPAWGELDFCAQLNCVPSQLVKMGI
jgi:hypothetical protein